MEACSRAKLYTYVQRKVGHRLQHDAAANVGCCFRYYVYGLKVWKSSLDQICRSIFLAIKDLV